MGKTVDWRAAAESAACEIGALQRRIVVLERARDERSAMICETCGDMVVRRLDDRRHCTAVDAPCERLGGACLAWRKRQEP